MKRMLQVKSFTLTEILVGSVIIVTIAACAFASAIFSQSLVAKERSRLIALEYISAVLEDFVFDAEFDDPDLAIGSHTIPSAEFPTSDPFWQTASPAASYDVSWYQIDPGIPINTSDPTTLLAKQITITVNWQEKSGNDIEARTATLSCIKVL